MNQILRTKCACLWPDNGVDGPPPIECSYHALMRENYAAELAAARAERDALLEALREAFVAFAHDDEGPVWADSTIKKARAAIKKATRA